MKYDYLEDMICEELSDLVSNGYETNVIESIEEEENKMNTELRLSKSVLGRLLNIIQEAMIAGVDIMDLMYEMRLTTTEDHQIVLTEEYTKKVDAWHAEIEEMLIKRQKEHGGVLEGTGDCTTAGGIIVDTSVVRWLTN